MASVAICRLRSRPAWYISCGKLRPCGEGRKARQSVQHKVSCARTQCSQCSVSVLSNASTMVFGQFMAHNSVPVYATSMTVAAILTTANRTGGLLLITGPREYWPPCHQQSPFGSIEEVRVEQWVFRLAKQANNLVFVSVFSGLRSLGGGMVDDRVVSF